MKSNFFELKHKQIQDEDRIKESIFKKIKTKFDNSEYNYLVDMETIIDNLDYFIELKNKIQRMEK